MKIWKHFINDWKLVEECGHCNQTEELGECGNCDEHCECEE